MKLNEFGNKCFAVGEKVRVNGIDYRFKAIVPNSGEGCDLYSEGQERFKGFCGSCGGCGSTFPKGTVRGHFKLAKSYFRTSRGVFRIEERKGQQVAVSVTDSSCYYHIPKEIQGFKESIERYFYKLFDEEQNDEHRITLGNQCRTAG